MTSIEFIQRIEEGPGFDPEDEEQVSALQSMIDTGYIWTLPRYWQTFAMRMIRSRIVKMNTSEKFTYATN